MDPYNTGSVASGSPSVPTYNGADAVNALLRLLQQTTASTSHSQSLFAPSVSMHNSIPSQSTPGVISPEVLQMLVLRQLAQQPANNTANPQHVSSQNSTLDGLAGTLPDDEKILVNTLSARALKGWSVRQALEALHGVGPHASIIRTALMY